jgi:hypothetical protein
MEIICYLPASSHVADLLHDLRLSLNTTALEVFDSLPVFFKRLLRPGQGEACLLLAPADDYELDALIAQLELLRDMPLVLVVPDLLSPTLAKAHLLRPRFLTDAQADVEEVIRVLERMVGRIREDDMVRHAEQTLAP